MKYLQPYYELKEILLSNGEYSDNQGRSSRAFNHRFKDKNFMAEERFFITLPKYYLEVSGTNFLGNYSIGLTILGKDNFYNEERETIPLFYNANEAYEFIKQLKEDKQWN